jgi:hypothetical protein
VISRRALQRAGASICVLVFAACTRSAQTAGSNATTPFPLTAPARNATPVVAPPQSAATQGARPGPALGVPASPAAAVSNAPATASAGPAILSVSVPSTVHAGETVSWSARTTPDVTSVEAHVRVATLPFQRRAPGNFTLAFSIPKSVPPFFRGSYSVDVVARTAGGATASRSVSIDFR